MKQQYFQAAANKYFAPGEAFELEGVQYPANWIENATAAEIEGIGLVPVSVTGVRGDDVWFDNSEILAGGSLTITATPKPLGVLRDNVLAAIKSERRDALDSFVPSAGVAEIYAENVQAVTRYASGDVTPMRGGASPSDYLTTMAAGMGLAIGDFVTYIQTEIAVAARKAGAVELAYLDYAYVRLPAADFAALQSLGIEFKSAIADALQTP